ncbi:MAG: hypothetical protein L0229_19690 [Blastocatellia bacterium]|nr:hypothetical protein [Blastocatellia bacterium]
MENKAIVNQTRGPIREGMVKKAVLILDLPARALMRNRLLRILRNPASSALKYILMREHHSYCAMLSIRNSFFPAASGFGLMEKI